MLSTLQRYSSLIFLLLATLLGLALGQLAATGLGIFLAPATAVPSKAVPPLRAPAPPPALREFEPILQRNLFDSSAPGAYSLLSGSSGTTPAVVGPRPNLTLLGTVSAGPRSLALLRAERETKTFRLDDPVPGGGHLVEINRADIHIRRDDGSIEIIPLEKAKHLSTATAAAPPSTGSNARTGTGSGYNVRSAGENRYVIPREEAEKARGNINELLKSARMEPNIVDGKTQGFAVRMIRPDSILDSLGLQKGDVVMQVNGVALDGPEKALQIFQQLREARHITISLERAGNPMNLDYDLD